MEADSQYLPLYLHPKAYRYFPKRQQEKSSFDKKGIRFFFFGQIQHDEYELRKLKQFHQYVSKKQIIYNKMLYPNDHTLVNLLAANGYEPKKTLKAMEQCEKFRLQVVPTIKLQRVQQLLKSGFYYVSGRDDSFRPIIVFRMKAVDFSNIDLVVEAIVYVFQQICAKMLLPGQVQNWIVIYDLEGIVNLMDLPMAAIKKMVPNMTLYYAFKLYKTFVFNAPSSINFFWKIVSTFLDDITVSKTKITKANTDPSLFEGIDRQQIEIKYGGTQPNRTEYFPFKIPPMKINEGRLVTDEQYEKMLKSGKLTRNKIDPIFTETKN